VGSLKCIAHWDQQMAVDQSNSEDGELIHEKKKNFIGIRRGSKDMNTRANLEEGPFWKKENVE